MYLKLHLLIYLFNCLINSTIYTYFYLYLIKLFEEFEIDFNPNETSWREMKIELWDGQDIIIASTDIPVCFFILSYFVIFYNIYSFSIYPDFNNVS